MDRPARRLKPLSRTGPRGRAGAGRLQSCAARRREPASSAEQQRQRELLRHAPGFVAVLRGPRHVLEFANESLLQLFLRDERIVGMTLREAFPELQGQGWFELLDAVVRRGERQVARGMPLALSAAPGAPVLELRLDLACEPIRDAAGTVTGVFCAGQDVTEILAAQQVLVHAEEQLRLATDAAEVGFWDVDPDSGAVQWPARVKAMFGLAEDARVTLDDFFAGLHPDDREHVRAAFAAACDPARRALYDVEYRTLGRLAGVLRWVAAKGRALFSAQGRCTRVLGTALDITARKAAQEALRRMDERSALLQAISDLSPDAIFAKDREGRLLFANPATLALVGKPADRVVGHTDAEFLDDAAAARLVMDNDRRVMEAARAQEVEEPLPHPDGSLRVWLSRKMPLRDGAGAVVGLLGVSRDITERKHLERELQDSKDALQRILDSITDGLAVLDAQWRYTYFNPQGARMLGLRSEDLLGRCLWELFPHAETSLFGREYRRAMATGEPTHFEEFYPAPLERWLECHCYPSARGLSVFFRDVTDRHRAEAAREASEEALRQSDRRKDEFLATLAHELRNPLAPLRNAAQLLAAPALRADQLCWIQRLIERQVGHMARLLDDLLDLARISQGKLHLKKERVTLAAIVEPAVEAARPLIEAKRHALTLALDAAQPDTLVLEADAVRLSQVLSNLLTNAAKYTDAGGHLLLSARREAQALVLEVSDDGIGLPAEARSRIFEMFGQLESGAGRSEGGLGIGLALVAGIVELHGGQVGVASEGPGRGSRFTVRLPLQALPDAPAPAPAVDGPRPGLRVLVADDNEDAAQTLALLLSFQGCETRVALSGAAAVETALRWPPDAAVLDIGMPGLDGHAVAQALRAQPGGARRLLVALTGWGQDADRRKSAAAGFDHHLTKPVDVPRLLAALGAA